MKKLESESKREYTIKVTKEEALLIKRLRELDYGDITVQVMSGNIIRSVKKISERFDDAYDLDRWVKNNS